MGHSLYIAFGQRFSIFVTTALGKISCYSLVWTVMLGSCHELERFLVRVFSKFNKNLAFRISTLQLDLTAYTHEIYLNSATRTASYFHSMNTTQSLFCLFLAREKWKYQKVDILILNEHDASYVKQKTLYKSKARFLKAAGKVGFNLKDNQIPSNGNVFQSGQKHNFMQRYFTVPNFVFTVVPP